MKPLTMVMAAFAVAAVVIGAMFLRNLSEPRTPRGRSWLCPRCGVSNEAGPGPCWSCGSATAAA